MLSVLNGCGPIVQEHHKVSADTAARSFRVVCEGGISLLLIAPSAQDKIKWMEGIEIMLIGGYKRKKESISDPLGVSAADNKVLERGQGLCDLLGSWRAPEPPPSIATPSCYPLPFTVCAFVTVVFRRNLQAQHAACPARDRAC